MGFPVDRLGLASGLATERSFRNCIAGRGIQLRDPGLVLS